MTEALRELVRQRARGRCEYCLLPEVASSIPFQIDHIISEQHRGKTVPSNLCLSCFYCNSSKGPNIASLDDVTKRLVKLSNPRRQKWTRHFRLEGPFVVGRTPCGRATILVLAMNDPIMVALREVLIAEGEFPPE